MNILKKYRIALLPLLIMSILLSGSGLAHAGQNGWRDARESRADKQRNVGGRQDDRRVKKTVKDAGGQKNHKNAAQSPKAASKPARQPDDL